MKIYVSIPILLIGCLLLPLRAQTPPDATSADTPDTGSAPVAGTRPPRHSINAMMYYHKANPANPPPEIAAAIDTFFKGIKAGDYPKTFETFLAGTRLGTQKDKLSGMVSLTEQGFGLYGAMNDYEIYDNYPIGSNILVLTYLSRNTLQPLLWRFIYYRADKKWMVINLAIDDPLLDIVN